MPTKERKTKDKLRDEKRKAAELFEACKAVPVEPVEAVEAVEATGKVAAVAAVEAVTIEEIERLQRETCQAWLTQCGVVRDLAIERLRVELQANEKAKAGSVERLAELKRAVTAEEAKQHPLDVQHNEITAAKTTLEKERDSGLRSREFASLDEFEAALQSGAIEIGLSLGARFIADRKRGIVRRESAGEGSTSEIVTPLEFSVVYNRQGEILDWQTWTVQDSQGIVGKFHLKHLFRPERRLQELALFEKTGERKNEGYRWAK